MNTITAYYSESDDEECKSPIEEKEHKESLSNVETNEDYVQETKAPSISLPEDVGPDQSPDTLDKQLKLRQILSVDRHYLDSIPSHSTHEPVDPIQSEKLRHFASLRAKGLYFNAALTATHAFRNPSIMSKMIDFLHVDEHGSNLDQVEFPDEAYYDVLSSMQDQRSGDVYIPAIKGGQVLKPREQVSTKSSTDHGYGRKEFVSSRYADVEKGHRVQPYYRDKSRERYRR